jgi:single-stranded-DNA-specific exonuclease
MSAMGTYSLRRELSEEEKKPLLEYPELVQKLLFHRGIQSVSDAQEFISPDYSLIHDPYEMKDMDKAVVRVVKAILNNEKIVIFSDYDADGIPGAVVLHDFFKKIGYENFINYIPHRHEEGFGLNMAAVEKFGESDTKVLITIDCGIADAEEVSRAQEIGIDVIITDHHLPPEEAPKAFSILNPKQVGCDYPEKMLCGSGVIFKFVQGLLKNEEIQKIAKEKNIDIKEGWEKWLLDMVGLATLSDMVPLKGENRIFAYYGLKVLRKSPRIGLMKLLSKLKTNQKYLVEDDIGFTISPRINAASRMGIPMEAFRLLATSDEIEADQLSEYLNKINDERKGMVAAMIKEMKNKLLQRMENLPKVIVMGNPDWKPALLGLAANTLMRDHNRPVFLWGREGGEVIKGSCRSDGSVNLVELMKHAPVGTFIDYGGHKLSGGFSVSHDKIHLLEEELERAFEKALVEKSMTGEGMIDHTLTFDDVNWNTYNLIEKLAPFGEGNPKPVFLFQQSEIAAIKKFGKESNHLELSFQNSAGKKIVAIIFFAAENPTFLKLKQGDRIDLVATLEKSMFRSFPELRLRIVDII